MSDKVLSRRSLLTGAAVAGAGVLLDQLPGDAQQKAAAVSAAPATTPPFASDEPWKAPGAATTAVGDRSPFFTPKRSPIGDITGSAHTPLQDLSGAITPSDLHFIRNHAGTPTIDPTKHTLLIHGLVDRPLEFTLSDLKRYPSTSRMAFVECAGNGRAAYRTPKPDMTPGQVDGLLSNSEWTGVPLSVLFNEVGVQRSAKYFLAEGADPCLMARTIPVSKAHEDAMIVWAQNGEPIRPEQGYPLRLLVPGFEGNMNVKWLRRIKLSDRPFMTRWETSKYSDPLPGDKIRFFSYELDAKSIITSPAFPEKLNGAGYRPITGLAWSGRGKIARVEITTNGGKSWSMAELTTPPASKAAVRFQFMWEWKGDENFLMSRAVDDGGYVQPTFAQFRAARGPGTDYHFNAIRGWRVARDGAVTFEANT